MITRYYNERTIDRVSYDSHPDLFDFAPQLDTELKVIDSTVTTTVGGKSVNQAIKVVIKQLSSFI